MDTSNKIIEFLVEIFNETDDTGFHAYCPALRGLHTCGDTEEETLQNARDAAIAYLQSLIKHGEPVPLGVNLRGDIKVTSSSLTGYISRHTEGLKVACAI